WRWEVLDDSHRTVASFADQPGAESGGSSPRELAGTGRQERARLRRVSRPVAELRGGCPPHALLAGTATTGPLALRKDLRPVRLRFPTFDRRKTDPRVANIALRARSQQRDSAGTARRGQDALECSAGRGRDPVWIRSVFHDRARSGDRPGAG